MTAQQLTRPSLLAITATAALRRQLPPSLGFTQNPYVNLGKVDNRGIEFALRGITLHPLE